MSRPPLPPFDAVSAAQKARMAEDAWNSRDPERVSLASSDVAFTPTVKAIQSRKGSRAGYARMEEEGGFKRLVTPDLAQFIARQRSLFLATANADGHPYIQHRGGPPGFLKVLDATTLGFADFAGNRQYITQGNLLDNPRAFIFLMDFAHRRRIKLWGQATIVEGDDALQRSLKMEGYKARVEQALVFRIDAWDANCPQHIPQLFEAEDVARALAERDARIAELEARLAEAASSDGAMPAKQGPAA